MFYFSAQASTNADKLTALYYDYVILKDSDIIEFEDLKLIRKSSPTPNGIFSNSVLSKILNSSLIRAFSDKSSSPKDLTGHIKKMSSRLVIGYWNTLTEESKYKDDEYYGYGFTQNTLLFTSYFFGFENNKVTKYEKYYNLLFSNKTARNLLYNIGVDVVLEMCKKYPKDFTTYLIKEVNELMSFFNSSKNNRSKIKAADNFSDSYWRGFIVRRILNNSVTIEEAISFLNQALKTLKNIDISKNPDAFHKLTINEEIVIAHNKSYFKIYSKKSKKEILLSYKYNIKKIEYLKDFNNSYYVFTYNKGKAIYDSSLNLID